MTTEHAHTEYPCRACGELTKDRHPLPTRPTMTPTNTPWGFGRTSRQIYGDDGTHIADIHLRPLAWQEHEDLATANAALIVRAVNSHAALVAACEAVQAFWNMPPTGAGMDHRRKQHLTDLQAQLTAALALTKGTP